ncbi:MAG TPA: hypothetical protein VJ276_00140, partial [Thermoanaerobaculia bacterium]|nr:hypothetical protein [Thermoanaerobaculia bacterium]
PDGPQACPEVEDDRGGGEAGKLKGMRRVLLVALMVIARPMLGDDPALKPKPDAGPSPGPRGRSARVDCLGINTQPWSA